MLTLDIPERPVSVSRLPSAVTELRLLRPQCFKWAMLELPWRTTGSRLPRHFEKALPSLLVTGRSRTVMSKRHYFSSKVPLVRCWKNPWSQCYPGRRRESKPKSDRTWRLILSVLESLSSGAQHAVSEQDEWLVSTFTWTRWAGMAGRASTIY